LWPRKVCHRKERPAARFNRLVTLPGDIDTSKGKAACSNGVLTVTLPKAGKAKARQITVKS